MALSHRAANPSPSCQGSLSRLVLQDEPRTELSTTLVSSQVEADLESEASDRVDTVASTVDEHSDRSKPGPMAYAERTEPCRRQSVAFFCS